MYQNREVNKLNKQILLSLLAQVWAYAKDGVFVAVDHQLEVWEQHNPKLKKWFDFLQAILPIIKAVELTATGTATKQTEFERMTKTVLKEHEIELTKKELNQLREDALAIYEKAEG